MRGKEYLPAISLDTCRITPAYAGKRNGTHLTMSCCWDHPRLCGEKSGILRAIAATTGSPPPMRGKAEQFPVDHGDSGITPAYAGKRSISVFHFPETGDHPRLCGEKLQDTADFTHVAGSPPPMRGKVQK